MEAAVRRSNRHVSTQKWTDSKRWDGGGEERRSGYPKSRGWMENSSPPPIAVGPSPAISSNGSVDSVLYQNLVEMIPLVESFMGDRNFLSMLQDQRGSQNRSFTRQASLVYTPAPPPRDNWPLKKKAAESPSKGRISSRGKRGGGDLLYWNEDGNGNDSNGQAYPEEIPALSLFTEQHQAIDGSFGSNAEFIQLQSQVKELEQKLWEKDTQLQSMADASELHELQNELDQIRKDLSRKDDEIHKLRASLLNKQTEIANVRARLEVVEADAIKSVRKASNVEQEMIGLRCQVTTLLSQLELIDAYNTAEGPTLTTKCEVDEDPDMEQAQRMYMAALIAARQKPEEELLSLVAESRAQLHSFLI